MNEMDLIRAEFGEDCFGNPHVDDGRCFLLGKLIGAGLSLFGGAKKGKAEAAVYKAQARAAELNAEQVRDRARIETTLRGRAGLREAGSISAATGASGLAGGGSAADILRESARNTQFDVASIKSQSALEAGALDATAEGYYKAAKGAKKNGLLGGALSAASLLL